MTDGRTFLKGTNLEFNKIFLVKAAMKRIDEIEEMASSTIATSLLAVQQVNYITIYIDNYITIYIVGVASKEAPLHCIRVQA